jgi:hypothetical protein
MPSTPQHIFSSTLQRVTHQFSSTYHQHTLHTNTSVLTLHQLTHQHNHQRISQRVSASAHQYFNTAPHQHINTMSSSTTYQHISISTRQHINTSTLPRTNTSTHQHIDMSAHHQQRTHTSILTASAVTHQHIDSSASQHICRSAPQLIIVSEFVNFFEEAKKQRICLSVVNFA